MVTVRIGSETRAIEDAHPSWINEQITRRQRDGSQTCVEVVINLGGINLRLATPACGGGGGGRPPNSNERELVNEWNQRGFSSGQFSGGDLVAFLRHVRKAA